MQTLTATQKNAAHRRDVYGVVYALSGTLRSVVSGIPDARALWSTKPMESGGPIASYSDGWETYIALPKSVTAEIPLTLGEVPPLHVIDILVKNLPFQHVESLLTAITDGVWSWEGTEATLFAAFQRKGQTAAEIPQADWFVVRRNGQFSGPQDIDAAGFTLPLVSREIVRRQQVRVREVTSGDFPNADPREWGKVLSTCFGAPDSWIRARRTNAGRFALTAEAVTSGSSDRIAISNDAGFDWSDMIGKEVYVNRGDKLLTVLGTPGQATLGNLIFTETIDFNVPQGSVVQERITSGYAFALLNQTPHAQSPREVAFELLDGTVVPLDSATYALGGALDDQSPTGQRTEILIYDTVQPPALIPRLNLPSETAEVVQDDLNITQQPDFDTNQKIEGTKNNYPDGPGFASAAYDGNDTTGYSVPSSGGGPKNSVTFTFPNVPGGNFSNSDTIRSTLHFITKGNFQVTDAGSTVFANVSGGRGSFTIVLGSPESFNQQVRFIEQGAGGIVYEVWWEHDLQADISLDRTDDVLGDIDVVVAGTGEVGFEMQPIRAVVARFNAAPDAAAGGSTVAMNARPGEVFTLLQERFLGEPNHGSGGQTWWNEDSYDAAEVEYDDHQIAVHFVIDRLFSWPELEAELAKQTRTYAYYGPEGHSLKFIKSAADLETITPAAEFRLPGVPNPNAAQTGSVPTMERTSLSELVNTVRVYYGRNWLMPRTEDIEERYNAWVEASNAESVALHGIKQDPNGAVEAWALDPAKDYENFVWEAAPWYATYSGDRHAEELAQFLADRAALGHTRFAFDTNGEVVGVERGDLVRVAFASARGVYRNVICEVESVKVTPIDANKYSLVCRSIGTPQKGLTSALIWTDLFTSDADTWADKITGVYDRWDQYWRSA